MELNYTPEHVAKTIQEFFGDLNLPEDTKEQISSEAHVYNTIIDLFHEECFFTENLLEDFVAMYWFYRQAFLKDVDMVNSYFDAMYLNNLCENDESEMAIWLVTRGPLAYNIDVDYCRAMLFIHITTEWKFENNQIPKLQTLLDMTQKFSPFDIYDGERFTMVEECENIDSIKYLISTIYDQKFINSKLKGLTPCQLRDIYRQKRILEKNIEELSNNEN